MLFQRFEANVIEAKKWHCANPTTKMSWKNQHFYLTVNPNYREPPQSTESTPELTGAAVLFTHTCPHNTKHSLCGCSELKTSHLSDICCFFSDSPRDVTIPAAGDALKRAQWGDRKPPLTLLHLDYT